MAECSMFVCPDLLSIQFAQVDELRVDGWDGVYRTIMTSLPENAFRITPHPPTP